MQTISDDIKIRAFVIQCERSLNIWIQDLKLNVSEIHSRNLLRLKYINLLFLLTGLLIAVNYISVIVYFPCVIIVYHLYFEKFKCCCCCPREKPDELGTTKPGTEAETAENTTKSKVHKPKKTRSNPLVQFFHGPYYRYGKSDLFQLCVCHLNEKCSRAWFWISTLVIVYIFKLLKNFIPKGIC